MNYLNCLAYWVLAVNPKGLSKVRFAKTLYFSHKSLVMKNLAAVNDLAFIRMPLGPVPVGFKELGATAGIDIQTLSVGLSYNKEQYFLDLQIRKSIAKDERLRIIDILTKNLQNFSTSQLVEVSHKENSWRTHSNGQEYYIDNVDLRKLIPSDPEEQLSQQEDIQKLQARLIEGMLEDIVAETTALEYPPTSEA